MDLGIGNRGRHRALLPVSGIGFACARELAREGVRVFLCSRDANHASEAAQKSTETGADVAEASPATLPMTRMFRRSVISRSDAARQLISV